MQGTFTCDWLDPCILYNEDITSLQHEGGLLAGAGCQGHQAAKHMRNCLIQGERAGLMACLLGAGQCDGGGAEVPVQPV